MNHPVGARVRTLIHLPSATWAPEQPDIPAGSLGTVDTVFTDSPDSGHVIAYGVMLDDNVDRLSAYMKPSDIGIWHGHDDPTCAYVGGISSRCTCKTKATP